MHQRQPFHVAAGILAHLDARFGVANAVDETLRVQSEAEADCAQPEKRRRAEIQSTEIRQRENRHLEPPPSPICEAAQVGAVAIDRRLASLPQPSQMRPPETTPPRTRDVFRRISLRMMQPVTGSPGCRRAGSVEHREKNQHAPRPRIQCERSMRYRTMVPDGSSQSAEEHQRHCAKKYRPSGKRIEHESNCASDMDQQHPEQYRNVAPRGVPPWLVPRLVFYCLDRALRSENCCHTCLQRSFLPTPPPTRPWLHGW